jgi:hypothetical protein
MEFSAIQADRMKTNAFFRLRYRNIKSAAGSASPAKCALLRTPLVSPFLLPATGTFRCEFKWSVERRLRRLHARWAIMQRVLIRHPAEFKASDNNCRIWRNRSAVRDGLRGGRPHLGQNTCT